jgi:hypothetical protein
VRTVVHQSFRETGAPASIGRCLASVAQWAAAKGYAYRFCGDSLFDRVPAWYRERVAGNRLPMSDLARLVVARELLAEGFARTIWVDADVLVFDPDRFDISVSQEYAVCREVWIRGAGRDRWQASEGLHNAVCVFVAGNSFLDFYIHACQEVVANKRGAVTSHEVGPDLLGRLAPIIGTRVIPDVGLFSPPVTRAIARGGGPALNTYRRHFAHPVRAANLCASFLDRGAEENRLTERHLDRAIDRLLATRGQVINDPPP